MSCVLPLHWPRRRARRWSTTPSWPACRGSAGAAAEALRRSGLLDPDCELRPAPRGPTVVAGREPRSCALCGAFGGTAEMCAACRVWALSRPDSMRRLWALSASCTGHPRWLVPHLPRACPGAGHRRSRHRLVPAMARRHRRRAVRTSHPAELATHRALFPHRQEGDRRPHVRRPLAPPARSWTRRTVQGPAGLGERADDAGELCLVTSGSQHAGSVQVPRPGARLEQREPLHSRQNPSHPVRMARQRGPDPRAGHQAPQRSGTADPQGAAILGRQQPGHPRYRAPERAT